MIIYNIIGLTGGLILVIVVFYAVCRLNKTTFGSFHK